jgi:hypothetical protein
MMTIICNPSARAALNLLIWRRAHSWHVQVVISNLILSTITHRKKRRRRAVARSPLAVGCNQGDDTMKRFPYLSRYPVRHPLSHSLQLLALAAVTLLSLSAITGERAEALSLINAGAVAAKKVAANDAMIEVRGGGHGGGHGGFGGGGGTAFHGGAFHAGPAFVGGGWHRGHGFAHQHHVRRVFIGGVWYDYPYYDDYPYYYGYPGYDVPPGCRIVITSHGPQPVCNYRPWRHHAHRAHHHRRHHRVDR